VLSVCIVLSNSKKFTGHFLFLGTFLYMYVHDKRNIIEKRSVICDGEIN
jgi:hypothetical protein